MELEETLYAVEAVPVLAKTAVLLSAISYSQNVRADLNTYLPGWTLVWEGIETTDGNFAFIASDPTGEVYGLAIRGSLPPIDIFKDWDAFANWILEDLDVLSTVTWHYTSSGAARISAGASRAFNNVAEMQDRLKPGSPRIFNFLKTEAVSKNKKVIITGHSLGGNIANVYASYFVTALKQEGINYNNTNLFTFAAPAAGDSGFATDLDNKITEAWHFENVQDVIPKCPTVSGLINASRLYVPSPASDKIIVTYENLEVSLWDAYVLLAGILYAYAYTRQERNYIVFGAALDPRYRNNTLTDYFNQLGAQHAMVMYTSYLKVKIDAALAARGSMLNH
ncbi:lipase family protein [Chitinophaga flava]|uniref:Fungal lipase-type domain-containing protein n=1 Tax=Chitinophaga flava TaxID=2259036 RepID=A0A365XWG0_9BACT|nr:hypothetical protein [Chitinophaga flava]RBL90331.1 hypothetical protein DF182_28100 [Chitinophaga flava]